MGVLRRSDGETFLVELLNDSYESKRFCDVKVFHDNQELLLHKVVLKSASKFWAKILDFESEDFSEIILDGSAADFDDYKSFFELIYKGSVTVQKASKEKIYGKTKRDKIAVTTSN